MPGRSVGSQVGMGCAGGASTLYTGLIIPTVAPNLVRGDGKKERGEEREGWVWFVEQVRSKGGSSLDGVRLGSAYLETN